MTCKASTTTQQSLTLARRQLLAGSAAGLSLIVSQGHALAAGSTPQVGSYLPPADTPGFVLFVPDRKKTPVSAWQQGCAWLAVRAWGMQQLNRCQRCNSWTGRRSVGICCMLPCFCPPAALWLVGSGPALPGENFFPCNHPLMHRWCWAPRPCVMWQALRAGTVDPSSPYRFIMPNDMREAKVANIQSGNYCQVGSWQQCVWFRLQRHV